MLDKDKFLVVSEHGFLLQMEKGEITRCEEYKGGYKCSLVKGYIGSLKKLPKKCPVMDGSDPSTLCPIIWLLTCYKEGMVDKKDVRVIMKGEFKLEETGMTGQVDVNKLELIENEERLKQQREELLFLNGQLADLERLISEKEEYFRSFDDRGPENRDINGDHGKRMKALDARERALDERKEELDEMEEDIRDRTEKSSRVVELIKERERKLKDRMKELGIEDL